MQMMNEIKVQLLECKRFSSMNMTSDIRDKNKII